MPAPSISRTIIRQPKEDVDDAGNRTVYHRGEGVRLISVVDPKGRLRRATCALNTDVIAWHHGAPLRTGMIARPDDDVAKAEFDKLPSGMRLERARAALGGYDGEDKYVRQFGRLMLSVGSLASADVVTGMGYAGELTQKKRRANARQQAAQKTALLGLGVALLAAVAFALLR